MNDKEKKELANTLKEWRMKRGLSRYQLSDELKTFAKNKNNNLTFSYSALRWYEYGKQKPRLDRLKLLVEFYGKDWEEFFEKFKNIYI